MGKQDGTEGEEGMKSAYDLMQEMTEKISRRLGRRIDFDIFYPTTDEYLKAKEEAQRINKRGKRTLRVSDRRTRGGKLMRALEREAWEKYERE